MAIDLFCQFCCNFNQSVSHCAVCGTCYEHSMHCKCSKQIDDQTSVINANGDGIESLHDIDFNENEDLNSSLFVNCNYYDTYTTV